MMQIVDLAQEYELERFTKEGNIMLVNSHSRKKYIKSILSKMDLDFDDICVVDSDINNKLKGKVINNIAVDYHSEMDIGQLNNLAFMERMYHDQCHYNNNGNIVDFSFVYGYDDIPITVRNDNQMRIGSDNND